MEKDEWIEVNLTDPDDGHVYFVDMRASDADNMSEEDVQRLLEGLAEARRLDAAQG